MTEFIIYINLNTTGYEPNLKYLHLNSTNKQYRINSACRSHTRKNYLTFPEIHKIYVTLSTLFKIFYKICQVSNFVNRSSRASRRRDVRDIESKKSQKLRKLGNACFYFSSYMLYIDEIRREPKFPEDFRASPCFRIQKRSRLRAQPNLQLLLYSHGRNL